MDITIPVPDGNKRRWTKSAVECLNNHCVCGTCPLSDTAVYRCHMKQTVLELYKKYGKPKEYIEPTIREEE